MALVAVHAVVHVTAHVDMTIVGVRLGVAVRALKYAVVRRIRMTGRTDTVRVAMSHREPRVIKGSSQPGRGGMTSRARGREPGRYVIRIVRSLVVSLVAAVAVGRDRGVVVVDVATRTRHGGVRPGQRETGVVVIEARRTPGRRAMAYFALLWKA